MKSSENRFTVVESLPGITLVTLRSARPATTVMHRRPLRLVSSMPIVSTPVQSSYRRADAAARTRPRHRHNPHAVLRAHHPWHEGVDERLVPEEIQVTPHAFHRVIYQARCLPASRLGTVETRAGPVSNRDVQLPPTRVGIAELHIGDVPGVDELQDGGEQHRGLHATKTTRPSSPPNPLHPHQTAKGQYF